MREIAEAKGGRLVLLSTEKAQLEILPTRSYNFVLLTLNVEAFKYKRATIFRYSFST